MTQLTTVEGTNRYLITRYTAEEADLFEALPAEFVRTITEVHYADGSDPEQVGQQGTYGIDLDDEWVSRIRGTLGFSRPSNLIDVVVVDPLRLGEYVNHKTSEAFEPLENYVDLDELPPPEEELVGASGIRKLWRPGPVTDQGREGACSGFAGANFLNNAPMMKQPYLTDADARQFYVMNKRKYDEWPGEDYDGSSVSAMCAQLIDLGRIQKAGMTRDFAVMNAWKRRYGPLMLSTPWYEGMYRTDSRGFIRPTGKKVGGHAIIDRGVTEWDTGVPRNSWGPDFGFNGDGYLAAIDYLWLIEHGLRAYTAIQTR